MGQTFIATALRHSAYFFGSIFQGWRKLVCATAPSNQSLNQPPLRRAAIWAKNA